MFRKKAVHTTAIDIWVVSRNQITRLHTVRKTVERTKPHPGGLIQQQAIEEDDVLLHDVERQSFQESIGSLKEAMGGNSHRLIQEQITRLDELSAEFSVRRINRSISLAVEGHKAEDLAG